MELSYKLEKMFPTEESRFDAYKKWLIISAVFQPFLLLDFPEVLELLRLVPQLYFINFINFGRLLRSLQISSVVTLISIVSSYIGIYIYWKSNVIKTLLKMSLGMLFGVVIMIIIERYCPLPPFIVPIVCLFINWNRLKEYRKGNERFIKDGLMLIVMISISAVIVSCFVLVYSYVPGHAINIRRIVFLMVIELAICILSPIYLIGVFNRERALGNTFANAYNQLTITTLFIIFSFTALTTPLSHNLFNGDGIVDDIKRAFSNSKAVRAERTPFIHKTDMSYTDICFKDAHVGLDNTHTDMDSYIDGTFTLSDPDLMDGIFMLVYGGTNMAYISHIQHHPYMIFNDPSAQGDFQICDPNGRPQMTITNGSIMNSENTVIGHVHTDAISGTMTYSDINNNPLYSVDSHGQMFSGKHYIGHTNTSGNVTVIRDMNEKIIARYDRLTHTWFDAKMSKPISQIKMM